jgi:TrmH family RNA methyltransferase
LDDDVLGTIAPTRHPQGVLAIVDEPCLGPWPGLSGVALFLDQTRDPGNTGAIIRSAAALDAAAVLLSPGCADPFHPTAVRGSAATVFRLPIERGVELEAAARRVHESSGEVWAADIGGENVDSWRPAPPTLIVLGTEGAGIDSATRRLVDRVVTIPLTRQVNSLNVAVAAAILLQLARKTT